MLWVIQLKRRLSGCLFLLEKVIAIILVHGCGPGHPPPSAAIQHEAWHAHV